MPKWARMAMYGAAMAVAVDYFLSPAARRAAKLR
jgi:hypothetical protein